LAIIESVAREARLPPGLFADMRLTFVAFIALELAEVSHLERILSRSHTAGIPDSSHDASGPIGVDRRLITKLFPYQFEMLTDAFPAS
jgi:hypothetical protein